MEKDRNKTDGYFRDRLANFEQSPDDHVWTRIAGRLGAARHRRMVYLFIRIAAGMTLLFSLALGYYLMNRPDKQVEPSIISYKNNDNKIKDSLPEVRSGKPGANKTQIEPDLKHNKLEALAKQPESPSLPEQTDSVMYSGSDTPSDRPVLSLMKGRSYSLTGVQVPLKQNHAVKSPVTGDKYFALGPGNFQDDETGSSPSHQWILGGEIAPLYSYRTIASDNMATSLKNSMNESEGSLIAYAGGIRIAYSKGRRLSVQSGVYYSRYGQQKGNVVEYKSDLAGANAAYKSTATFLSIPNSTGTIVAGKEEKMTEKQVVVNSADSRAGLLFDSNSNAINPAPLVAVEGKDLSAMQYFDYLELPLNVKYKIINRKFGFSFVGGLVTNFLVNNRVIVTENGNKQQIGKTADISKVNYLGSIGLGFEYPVIKKMAFSLEPRFRYYINPIDQSNNVHPYSFGIFAGFSYDL